jgi:hypothetical protein
MKDYCIKKAYSYEEAEQEVRRLLETAPKWNWEALFCEDCGLFHIIRQEE